MAIADLHDRFAPDILRGPPCAVCQLLGQLDTTEADALRQLLGDPLWRYSHLSDALAAEGHKVPSATLARHARGKCAAAEKLR